MKPCKQGRRPGSWPFLRLWPVLALATLCLTACGGGGGGGGAVDADPGTGGDNSATLSADVMPLATGDLRHWRITGGVDSGQERTERVGESSVIEGRTAYRSAASDGSVEYLVRTGAGLFLQPGPESDAIDRAIGAVEFLRFGHAQGETLVLYERTVSADLDGDGRNDSLDLRMQSTYVGPESVSTPAGHFDGAAHMRTLNRYKLRYAGSSQDFEFSTQGDIWYARGVGPVRAVFQTLGDASSTATEELLSYGVGGLRSETVAPTLLSTVPEAGAALQPGAQVVLNFSEAMDALSVDLPGAVRLLDASGQAVAATAAWFDGGKQLVLTPAQTLPEGRYALTLGDRPGGALTDRANNPVAAQSLALVVDTRGPQLLSTTPAANAQDVPVTGQLVWRFDEPVFATHGATVAVSLESYGSTVTLQGRIQGNEVVATIDVPLAFNREYSVSLGPLADRWGNAEFVPGLNFSMRTEAGAFARPVPWLAAAEVLGVKVGDVNADGRADLLAVTRRMGPDGIYNDIVARLQQADGRFADTVRLHTWTPVQSCNLQGLEVADVSGDGRADVTLLTCDNRLAVFLQQPDGRWLLEPVGSGVLSGHVQAEDLEGDGHTELLAAAWTQFEFWRRDPTGAWAVALAVDGGTEYILDWRLVDLNADGRKDLVWLRSLPGGATEELAWALRQGAGFGAVRSLPLTERRDARRSLAVADVTGDARPDVLLTLKTVDGLRALSVLRQDASGGFEAPVYHPSPYELATLETADVNGDGRLDVLVTHDAARVMGVYLQAPDGSLQAERLFESPYGYFWLRKAMAVLDLNADGLPDVVLDGQVMLRRPVAGAWPAAALPATGATRALGVRAAKVPEPAAAKAPPRPGRYGSRILPLRPAGR